MNHLKLDSYILTRQKINYILSRNIIDKPTEFAGGTRGWVIYFLDWNISFGKSRNILPTDISSMYYQWNKRGKLHNLHGPAYIGCTSGNIEYWINHEYYYSKKEWEKERLKYIQKESR